MEDSPHDPRPCKTQVCATLEMDVVQWILRFCKRINGILNLLILNSVSLPRYSRYIHSPFDLLTNQHRNRLLLEMEYLELEYMSLRSTCHPGNPPLLLTPVRHCPWKDLRSWNQNMAVTSSFKPTSLSKNLFHQVLYGREGCQHFSPSLIFWLAWICVLGCRLLCLIV